MADSTIEKRTPFYRPDCRIGIMLRGLCVLSATGGCAGGASETYVYLARLFQNRLADKNPGLYLHCIVKSLPDTIAAISTASGESGIAVVRVSGPTSLNIADKIFRCKGAPPSQRPADTFVYGFIRSAQGNEDADEAVLLIFLSPHSYTTEDVVEIQGHGGRTCAKRILRTVLEAGARPAEPGEFTRRAFLNGRIDLLQAEAVADLISARSDRAATAALEQLEGSLSSCISDIYDILINSAGDLEAGLDFPEEEMPPALMDGAVGKISTAKKKIENLLGTWEEGHLLREGALIVISGKPNVGKSTLLNCLLGTNRAIVAAEPGTTRDTIEEDLILDGVPLRLVDTAGLRNTESVVEREGVQRARALIQNADINIHVYDCSTKLDGEDLDTLKHMDTRKSFIILNKTDLGQKVRLEEFSRFTVVPACLTKDQGLEDIRKVLADKIGSHVSNVPHATISERHRNIIQIVQSKLNEAIGLLSADKEDMIVPAISALRSGIETLGLINGKTYDKALLDNIFSRFCIGK